VKSSEHKGDRCGLHGVSNTRSMETVQKKSGETKKRGTQSGNEGRAERLRAGMRAAND